MSKTEYNELDYVCALDLETTGLNEQGDQVLEVAPDSAASGTAVRHNGNEGQL